DYKRPGHTPIWPNLRSSRDQEVRQLTETLERYCKASVAELPSLEQALRGKRPGRRRRRSADADVSKAEVDESGTISVVAHVGKEGASLTFPESPDRNGAPPRTAERSGPDQTQPPWADAADPPSNIRSDELTSPASGRKTDAPASDPAPAPAESSGSRSWRVAVAAILVLLILAIGATIVWAPWEREEPATTEPATSETDGLDVPGEYGIAPSDLAGFYTGYNTLPDGERGSIGLEITGPARVGDTVTFSFTLNSLRYQLEGTGTFDPTSGHLDLNGQYFLHARYNARDRLELSSLPPGNPNPTLRVTKTDDL
ncbi:MAG: hypothetical protein GVY18_02710, partial [Bacteroidetes bacterium]|nr:hypothetical protein [Bacteroidota bacterium]